MPRVRPRLDRPLGSYRCAGADPVVRACVIPSRSRNCIAISAQARIGSSSAHFTSIALSPCSTRKWAALEGGGGPSLRGLPGGCGACPVVVGLPGCGAGDGAAAGADGRVPLVDGCGGCPNAAVASSTAPTPKHTVDCFNTVISWPSDCASWLSTATCVWRSALNGLAKSAPPLLPGGSGNTQPISATCDRSRGSRAVRPEPLARGPSRGESRRN
jgi:hypothetical protein